MKGLTNLELHEHHAVFQPKTSAETELGKQEADLLGVNSVRTRQTVAHHAYSLMFNDIIEPGFRARQPSHGPH